MSTGLTARIADFVAGIRYDDIPGPAMDVVRTGLTDCVAVMIAGAGEPVTEIVGAAVPHRGGKGDARICLSPERAAAADAALIAGTAAHALDYDDVAMDAHPSSPLVATLLSAGEALGSSGRELVTAYVAGYEAWADLAYRDRAPHHAKGWHPTAIFGVVAAAAAAAVLYRLAPAQVRAALGIAASHAGGIAANFGTMTKPFHVGRAAAGGIMAARLARAGMTAADDALEHPLGYLSAISPGGEVDRDAGSSHLGREWRILRYGLNVKKYPLCYAVHRALDGFFDLAAARPVAAGEIADVEMRLGATQAAILRNHRPRTAIEARFSGEFACAAAAVAGTVGLRELSDDFVRRDDVRRLMEKVAIATTEATDADAPAFAPADRIVVRLAGGEILDSGEIRHARGHARLPLTRAEMWTKFADCVSPAAGEATARTLFDRLQRIEELANVADLPTVGRT